MQIAGPTARQDRRHVPRAVAPESNLLKYQHQHNTPMTPNPIPYATPNNKFYPKNDACRYEVEHSFSDGQKALVMFCGNYEKEGKLRCYIRPAEKDAKPPLDVVSFLAEEFQEFVNFANQPLTLLYILTDGKQLTIAAVPHPAPTISIQ